MEYHCARCGYVDKWNTCYLCIYCGAWRYYETLERVEKPAAKQIDAQIEEGGWNYEMRW